MIHCSNCDYKTNDGAKLANEGWKMEQSRLAETYINKGMYLEAAKIKRNLANYCRIQLKEKDAYMLDCTVEQYRKDDRITQAQLDSLKSRQDVQVRCPRCGHDVHWELEDPKDEQWKREHSKIAQSLLQNRDYLGALIVYEKIKNCCHQQGKLADRDRLQQDPIDLLEKRIKQDEQIRQICANDPYYTRKVRELEIVRKYRSY